MASSHMGRGLIHNGPLADYYWIFGGPSLVKLLGYKHGYLGCISWAPGANFATGIRLYLWVVGYQFITFIKALRFVYLVRKFLR